MTVEDWLRAVTADAHARGLTQLEPLVASLALSTRRLRDADLRLGAARAADGRADAGTSGAERER